MLWGRSGLGSGPGIGAIDSLILAAGSTPVAPIVPWLETLSPDAKLVRTDVLDSVDAGLAMDARRKFG